MTNVNTNNENETKPDIFTRDIFKSDIISHWSINIKNMQQPLFFSFLKKTRPKNKKNH